jgi:hypothetical protein
MSKTIGIIGSRRRNSQKDFYKVLETFTKIYEEGDRICSGGCPQGGDAFANKIAQDTGIPILIFYPAWKKYGKGAGFIRNGLIAQESDVLIACVSEDRTGGTADTIIKFEKYAGKHAILC